MRLASLLVTSSCALLGVVSGCSLDAEGAGGAGGPGLDIQVAPLTLPGLTDACYSLSVFDASPAAGAGVVWSKAGVCASRFGNAGGGDISYVGTCVAESPDQLNAVQLVIEDLYTSGVSPTGTTLASTQWQNPCPASAPCELAAPCRENQDVPVVFNLVVIRDADQGFFDIAVNFEDVFCSAKLDCVDALLHDPATDERGPTAVVAFACTSGETETHLYLDDLVITCDGQVVSTIDPELGPGQIGAQGTGAYQAAIYKTLESFPAFQKCAWNTAIGLDLDGLTGECSLMVRGTASQAALAGSAGAYTTPAGTVYPVVVWDVDLTSGGAMICGKNALNGATSGVVTDYTSSAGATFANHLACGDIGGAPPPDSNNAPATVGTPSAANVAEGASVEGWVLGTLFSDPDGDPLTYTLINAPSWASLVKGKVVLAPGYDVAPFAGSFQVRATDLAGLSVQQSFDVQVSDTNRAPATAGTPSAATVAEGDSVEGWILANFFDDPDGDALTFSLVGAPAWASVVNGNLVLAPGHDVAPFMGSITVRATDGGGFSVQRTFDVEVSDTNRAPTTAGNPDVVSVAEGDSVDAWILADFFNDPDGETLTFSLAGAPSWATIVTGKLVLAPGYEVAPFAGSITVQATDGGGLSVQRSFDVEVTDTNRAPTAIATLGGASVAEGETFYLDFGVGEAFSDPDGDTLTYSLVGAPSWASLDGETIVLTPGFDVTNADLGDYEGSFTVRATDGGGLFMELSFGFLVSNVDTNAAPVAVGTPDSITVVAGQGGFWNLNDFFGDPDGDFLTYQIISGPEYALIAEESNLFVEPPAEQEATEGTIVVRATDPGGLFIERSFDFLVDAGNRGPVTIGTPPALTVVEEGLGVWMLGDFFSDPNNSPLTFTIISGPAYASLQDLGGSLVLEPAVGDGPDEGSVIVRATNALGLFVQQTFDYNITEAGGGSGPYPLAVSVYDGAQPFSMASYFPPTYGEDGNITLTASSATLPVSIQRVGAEWILTITPVHDVTPPGSNLVTVTARDQNNNILKTVTFDVDVMY